MNRDNILSALAAGTGALELIKKVRSLEEVNVSKKPWKSGDQRYRWKNAMNKRMGHGDGLAFLAKEKPFQVKLRKN